MVFQPHPKFFWFRTYNLIVDIKRMNEKVPRKLTLTSYIIWKNYQTPLTM